MALGDLLKQTINELERARIDTLKDQAVVRLEKTRKQRAQREKLIEGIKTKITSTIVNGKVPLVKISVSSQTEWINQARQGKADNQDLWRKFISEMGQEKLYIEVNECRSKCGGKSWLEITAKPSNEKVVYRSDGTRHSTASEMMMDYRPVVDPAMKE